MKNELRDAQQYPIDRDSVDAGEGPISRDQLIEWGLEHIGADPLTEGDGYRLGSYYDGASGEVWAADYDEPAKKVRMNLYRNAAEYVADRASEEDKIGFAKSFLGLTE